MSSVIDSAGSALPPLGEEEIARRVLAERSRLEQAAGLAEKPVEHFHRPLERPFTAEERDRVTISAALPGNTSASSRPCFAAAAIASRCCQPPTWPLSRPARSMATTASAILLTSPWATSSSSCGRWKHEVFPARKSLPITFLLLRDPAGLPTFRHLQSEYRMALENAGFGDFRVLLFQQDHGVNAMTGNTGLKLSVDLGMGRLNAVNLGDVINDMVYQIRPCEVVPGATDQAIQEVVDQLSDFWSTGSVRIAERVPEWISRRLAQNNKLQKTCNMLGKIIDHLYSKEFVRRMHLARERLNRSKSTTLASNRSSRSSASSGRNLLKETAILTCSALKAGRRAGMDWIRSADGSAISFISLVPAGSERKGH